MKTNKGAMIIELMQSGEMFTISEIARITGLKLTTVKNYMYQMREAGEAYAIKSVPMKNGWDQKFWVLGTDPHAKGDRGGYERIVKVKKCAWHEVPKAANWGGYLAAA